MQSLNECYSEDELLKAVDTLPKGLDEALAYPSLLQSRIFPKNSVGMVEFLIASRRISMPTHLRKPCIFWNGSLARSGSSKGTRFKME
jgi:hypothetical protein